jgi:hypothetical protein
MVGDGHAMGVTAKITKHMLWPDDLLPASSRTIHVVGELSPSKEWCAFEFLPTDSQNLLKNLKSLDALSPPVKYVRSPRVSWWPSVLEGNLDVEKIHNAGFQLFVVERPANSVAMGIYLFALDLSKGRGFFYWTYKSDLWRYRTSSYGSCLTIPSAQMLRPLFTR